MRCPCVPKVLKKWVKLGESSTCVDCKKAIDLNGICMTTSVLVPCVHKKTRCHIITAVIHCECTLQKFDFKSVNCTRLPFSPPILPQKMLSDFQQVCFSKNKLTGRICDACGSAEAFSQRMAACSKCMGVSYCDAECQQKDWPQHKQKCATLPRRPKAKKK